MSDVPPEIKELISEFLDLFSNELGEPLPTGFARRIVDSVGTVHNQYESGLTGSGSRRDSGSSLLQAACVAVIATAMQSEILQGRDMVEKALSNGYDHIPQIVDMLIKDLPEGDLTETELEAALLRAAHEFRRRRKDKKQSL